MYLYKNVSRSVKTFYGVEFKPGEVKYVPKHINHPKFVYVNTVDIVPKEPPKSTEVKRKKSDKDVEFETNVDSTEIIIEEDIENGADSHK